MKSVTEFPNHKLEEGIKAKAALAAEGKTPEETSAAIGEKFKLEGDKLKYFENAVEIASKSTEKLFRVQIVKLDEGQNPPPRATVIEELCYIAIPQATGVKAPSVADIKAANRGGRDGNRGGGSKQGGKGGGKPKSSPWGISPEEKEAKEMAARQAAREKSLAGKS